MPHKSFLQANRRGFGVMQVMCYVLMTSSMTSPGQKVGQVLKVTLLGQFLPYNMEWNIVIIPMGHHPYTSHYNGVIMSATVFQITGVSIVYSTVCSRTDQRRHQTICHWPSWREFSGDRWISPKRASNPDSVSVWWFHRACCCFVLKSEVKNRNRFW